MHIRAALLTLRSCALGCILGCALIAQSAAADELNVKPFTGTYSVEYRGIRAGNIDFILRQSNGGYIYESVAHPRGIARLVVNSKTREASEFIVENGVIKPLRYELDDGTSDTDEDTRLTLDWAAKKASGRHEDQVIELPLSDGVQDRMSAQVAVMQALLAGKQLDKQTFIDRDALKEYTYVRLREEKLKTQLGEIDTIVYSSSRPGSNRVSRLWYAPSLGYAPVRGEQERKGKIETVFEIQKMVR
jgi:hypothetical protein